MTKIGLVSYDNNGVNEDVVLTTNYTEFETALRQVEYGYGYDYLLPAL